MKPFSKPKRGRVVSSALSLSSNDTNGTNDSPSSARGASKKAKIATSLKLEAPEPSKLDSNEIDQAILSVVDILFKEYNENAITKNDIYFNVEEILQIKIKSERKALIKARLMEQIDVQEEVDAILSCVDLLFKEANKNVVTKKDIYFNAQEILQRKIKGERRALIKARLMDLIDEFEFDDKAQVAVGVEAQL